MEAPFVLTVQSNRAWTSIENGRLVICYQQRSDKAFDSRHFARLIHASGLEQPFFVWTSFTDLQPFNCLQLRSLGLSSCPRNQFVGLANNTLPALISFTLSYESGQPFTELPSNPVTLLVQIAPEAWATGPL